MTPVRTPAAQGGFTLIELLIVVAIIGILAAVAVPAYNGYTQKAKFSSNVSMLGAVKTAIEACYSRTSSLASCDTVAELGIPALPTLPEVSTGLAITANTAALTFTSSAAAGSYTYNLVPTAVDGVGITWAQASTATCVAAGVC